MINQKEVEKILSYDPKTGFLFWQINSKSGVRVGDVAGSPDNNGYNIIRIGKKNYKAHRLAFLLMEGYMPENDIDHKDRDPSNNKWNNLREASKQCNARNRKVRTGSVSGITGVTWYKRYKKWRSVIMINGKNIYLGQFNKKHDAAKARWGAEKKHNWPNCNTTSSAYLYLKTNNLIGDL